GKSPLPLPPGASSGGAVRNHVRVCAKGYFQEENRRERNSLSVLLFGAVKGDTGTSDDQSDPGGEQSRLIIDDALGTLPEYGIEVRDGVRIDGKTRTAQDKFKFDLELLPTGTTFTLRFELLIGENDDAVKLKQALALALHGLETSAITIGARKTRGFGRCEVQEWSVTTYNLRDSRADLLAWLAADHAEWGFGLPPNATRVGKAADKLIALPEDTGKRHSFTITADFALESPLLIRSEEPMSDDDNQPDFAHIRDSSGNPIIPGTSLAGALRARATRILNTIKPTSTQTMIDSLFGKDMHADPLNPTASRLVIEETQIEQAQWLVQNRVAIDRFTGGAFDTALFNEAPLVAGGVKLTLTIRDHPKLTAGQRAAERGLLLLLLKDLWTSDLSLGGTSSIGRGRLRGLNATIKERVGQVIHTWAISEMQGRLSVGDDARQVFEQYVTALNELEARTDA
ncbi:MAG: RAMP superfamily CRISPR-associated protein, partial [Roseiflexaceae bacterium]|nr:RAMP superfamily CRISPR-associated protein [Roseiflexaceae bacterium]